MIVECKGKNPWERECRSPAQGGDQRTVSTQLQATFGFFFTSTRPDSPPQMRMNFRQLIQDFPEVEKHGISRRKGTGVQESYRQMLL